MKAKEIIREGYIAFELDKKSRRKLMKDYPPKYPDVIANHITHKSRVNKDEKLPKNLKSIEVVGYADDGESIEALVVEVNGKTTRPDGRTYHITWSLDRSKGKTPVHSNQLIMSKGYENVTPTQIKAKTKLFK